MHPFLHARYVPRSKRQRRIQDIDFALYIAAFLALRLRPLHISKRVSTASTAIESWQRLTIDDDDERPWYAEAAIICGWMVKALLGAPGLLDRERACAWVARLAVLFVQYK